MPTYRNQQETELTSDKRSTVRHISNLAGSWRQPCFTGEDLEPRYQQALAMIHEIAEWALHPARGDEPPTFR
jgi:hypothetical protein